MSAQLIYEVVLDETYSNPETREKLKTEIVFLLNTGRRSNVVKLWFLSSEDARIALNDVLDLKRRKFPRAVVSQNYNYILVMFNGVGYVEPYIEANTILSVPQPEAPKKKKRAPAYNYIGKLEELMNSNQTVMRIPLVFRNGNSSLPTPKPSIFHKTINRKKLPIDCFSRDGVLYLIKKENGDEG